MRRDDEWLTISDAAAALDVSVSTLRAWCTSGRIACCTTRGGHRRFSRDELRRWLASTPAATASTRRPSLAPAAAPRAGAALAAAAGDVAVLAESYLSDDLPDAERAGTQRERRIAAAAWLRQVADGLASGDMRAVTIRATAHGHSLRQLGASAAVMVAGLEAMERAVDDALAHAATPVALGDRDAIIASVQLLSRRALESWATAA